MLSKTCAMFISLHTFCNFIVTNCNANLGDNLVKLQMKMGRIILQADPRNPTGSNFMALLTVSKESALTETGNSVLTASVFHR